MAVPLGERASRSDRAATRALATWKSGAVLETPGFVAGLDDVAVMSEAIEQRGCEWRRERHGETGRSLRDSGAVARSGWPATRTGGSALPCRSGAALAPPEAHEPPLWSVPRPRAGSGTPERGSAFVEMLNVSTYIV